MDTCNVCTTGPSKATTKAYGVRHCQMRAKTNNNLHVCDPENSKLQQVFKSKYVKSQMLPDFEAKAQSEDITLAISTAP